MNSVQYLHDQQAPSPPLVIDNTNQVTMYNITLALNVEMLHLIWKLQQQVSLLKHVHAGTPTAPPDVLPALNPIDSTTCPCGRCITKKYYWTHGTCAHTSIEYTNKKWTCG